MRISILITAGLAAGATASSWFSKPVYSKWDALELVRWLDDNDVPHPKTSDRKELEKLVEENWNKHVVAPYESWSTEDMASYLKAKGIDAQNTAAESKDGLLSRVKSSWYETEDQAHSAWASVKDWIFDTWTESSIKAFCDKHNIPVPQPRTRDAMLQNVRSNYEDVAKKMGETTAYPGNWLYSTWSDADLQEWLDTHGFPAPQPSTRDKLTAAVRRNSRLAHLRFRDRTASASSSAQAAYATVTDKLLDSWSESDIKAFLDKNGVPVPQGTKANELRALVRKHRAQILGDTLLGSASSSASKASGAASDQYAKASDAASDKYSKASDAASGKYAQASDAASGKYAQASDAASGKYAQASDAVSGKYAQASDAASEKYAQASDAASEKLSKASDAASGQYAKATNAAGDVAQAAFDQVVGTWSESRLKAFLDARGVPVPQASKTDELRALVRKHRHKAASGWSVWTFDDYTYQNLKDYLLSQGDATAKSVAGKKDATREELVSAAQSAYASASSAGGHSYASATSYLSQATAGAKHGAWDTWSESELKAYLDSYGVPVPQGSTLDEIRAYARRQSTYFKYGTSSPSGTLLAKVEESIKGAWGWAASHFSAGADAAEKKAARTGDKIADKAKDAKVEL